jgi:hypothetical protein
MSGWRKRQIADKVDAHYSNTDNPVDFPPAPDPIDSLMYSAGLTAQGCWDEMDDYNRTAIERFAELIIFECIKIAVFRGDSKTAREIKEHFGYEI